ncbi:hypothetical protein [Micromonospora cremea]|uniref:DUF4760 domain-containing protein n=1 Tax=Micromonospora cremea TaxID=709881 RepID=A0A1N5TR46_9ACTN|nr:hypothetical protein [Micromonospora cremea]SIM50791.1 hypothetical protein SAMN04489832_0325 [Micromonospora cremea]
MTTAVITASASIVVAVLVFVLNQRAQLRAERRLARLDRVARQLRDLYGPLHALVDVNERLWRALRDVDLPDSEQRKSDDPLPVEQQEQWMRWLQHALVPANIRMRDLIIGHADLVIEDGMPEPLRGFCAHVAAYEVMLSSPDQGVGQRRKTLIRHPGAPYVDYVRRSFDALKREQRQLMATQRKRWRFTAG